MLHFHKLCALISIMFFSITLTGQASFVMETFTTDNFPILQDCVVDMNGDHLDDIVGISNNVLVIAYQELDGSFSYKYHYQNFKTTADWSICAGDIDANGFNDLIIGGSSAVSFVYANNNGSAFSEDAKDPYIFAQRTNFVDINNDGHLDAFICHDVGQNQPYRNDGNGNLVLDQSLITTPLGPGNYESVWVDYDNDGDIDMHMSKCVLGAGPSDPNRINLLYSNDGNGNFTEVGEAAGLADGDQSWVSIFEDFDNDGDFDVFTLNHEQANQLQRNNGDGTFTNVTMGSGLETTDLSAYEGLAADFDNDGDIDILRDNFNTFSNEFYINNGDMTFTIVPTDVTTGALGDLNNDGFIDVLKGLNVFYNQGNDNHWLRINTIGRESNRNGIGARIEAHGDFGMKIKEVRASASWSPMSTLGTHIGLGATEQIDSIVVKWPSGLRSVLIDPVVDQVYTVDEFDCPSELVNVTVDGELSFCDGESAELSAPAGFTYLWSTGETSQSITVDSTGGYNVTVSSATGCTAFSKVLDVNKLSDAVSVLAPDGLEFCGAPIRLQADTDQPVVWSTGETTQTIWIDEEGDYFVSAENDCGDNVQSETVAIENVSVNAPSPIDTTVAAGIELLTFSIEGNFVLWYDELDGNPIFIGNDFFISNITENDTFYVQSVVFLPNGQECYSERVPITIFVETTATNDFISEIGLKVYPNPAQGKITVDATNIGKVASIKLYDSQGKLVEHTQSTSGILTHLEWTTENGILWIVVETDRGIYRAEIVSMR